MSQNEIEENLREKAANLVEWLSFLLEFLEGYA